MALRIGVVWFVLLAVWAAPPIAVAEEAKHGCEDDYDCKGDRVCESGHCVDSHSKPRARDNEEDEDAPPRSRSSGASPADFPHFCCTRVGKLGPYPNTVIGPGQACYGTHPMFGVVYGYACY
ncbi:MAG TPA: hypothetical protein VMR50_12555 [Myxococcota bacterium]|nr:hypothetical protein [Myxococcota bacterium]